MKFQDVTPFVEFYKKSQPPMVLIISDGSDNNVFFNNYLFQEGGELYRYDADNLSSVEFYGHMENYGFLSSYKTIVISKLEVAKASLMKAIHDYCMRPSNLIKLILYSSQKKDEKEKLASTILANGGALLNRFNEKIYVKENRIIKELQELATKHNKKITTSVVRLLMNLVGSTDIHVLQNELSKLIAYVGDLSEITHQDVKEVVVSCIKTTFWKINNLIFRDDRELLLKAVGYVSSADLSEALGLVAFLRNRMSEALSSLETGFISEKDGRYMDAAKRYGIHRIKMALIKLFEAEQALKAPGADARLILEILSMGLTHYVTSPS